MEHLYIGSSVRIKPQGFVEGGRVTFFTVNQIFGTTLTDTDTEGYITLSWPHLQYMGRGVLQYIVNNPTTHQDMLVTTDYFIESNLEVAEDKEALGSVSDKVEERVTTLLADKIEASINKVTSTVNEKVEQASSKIQELGTNLTDRITTLSAGVDSKIGEIQADLVNRCPYVSSDYYVYNYDKTTGSFKKTDLYVKGQDGRNGIDGRVKEVRHQPTETDVTIRSGEFHVWNVVESLNITLQPAPNSPFLDEYGFSFKTGQTAPRISLPSNIKLPRTFIILPNHIYLVTILGTTLEFGSQSL